MFDGKATLYVADSGNNRVLAFPEQQTGTFSTATRLLGQSDFEYTSLNEIDGREVGFSDNTGSCSVNGSLPFLLGGSAVIDSSSSTPHLYIADPLNNRVLAYRDYRKVNAGVTADLVIGQPDLSTALVNYPSNSPTQANAEGLWSPEGLAVDANGNLYVADTCNARVVRYPSPFAQTTSGLPQANLVLGQTSLVGQPIKDVSCTDHEQHLRRRVHGGGRPGGFRSSGESHALFQKKAAGFSIRRICEQRFRPARFQFIAADCAGRVRI